MFQWIKWHERAAEIAAIQDPEEYHSKEDGFILEIFKEIDSGKYSRSECRKFASIAMGLLNTARERWYA